ncbi:uncharacterized protein LOC123878751 [Maniola jurtina]|uniref:uncharacterized protein LOC123878751 n=1 Tax=Maniola jurtina TaxID=191418 RepID=UPI001E689890|nr:uncharacterized protein LOC123878751 [Maniola jurtina]
MWLSFIIILLSLQVSVAERDMIPVFVIDYEKVLTELLNEANPFMKMKSTEFSKIIEQAIERAKVVILFVEETFCTEDISIKDKKGSPFYHLGQALKENRVKYLPTVSQAFKTLKSHLQPLASYAFYLSDSNSKLQIYDQKLRHFYIYFKDRENETRVSALRRHDLLMKEVYFVVREIAAGPVVAFYTGKVNPVVVERLTFVPIETPKVRLHPGVTISSAGALFRFIDVYTTTGTRSSMFSQIPLVAEESWQEHGLTTRMAYTDFELEFNFDFKDDGWTIENVALLEWGEEVGRTDMRAGAPWNWSYVCSEPLVLVNMRDGSAVTISHYQIQPFNFKEHIIGRNANSSNEARCFGPAVNCGPYFSAQILAGLMVTCLCVGILTYGVASMYSIHANTRYDDSQGKPLVI